MRFMADRDREREIARQAEKKKLENEVALEQEKAESLYQRVQCPICFDRDRDAIVVCFN